LSDVKFWHHQPSSTGERKRERGGEHLCCFYFNTKDKIYDEIILCILKMANLTVASFAKASPSKNKSNFAQEY
jgi:hypothetical protein